MNFEYYYKLQKSGDLVNAEKGYKKLLRKNIKSVDIFLCLGFIYMKTNRFYFFSVNLGSRQVPGRDFIPAGLALRARAFDLEFAVRGRTVPRSP